MATPGKIAKFDPTGKVTDSIITETNAGSIGIGTSNPSKPLTIQAQRAGQELIGFQDPSGATKWHINQNLGGANPGLNFVESGVADARLFLKAGGNVGIGTPAPSTSLHVAGNLTLDSGASPVLYTGTGNVEQNRYLQLINSLNATSASGLKAGGVLVADTYAFADPGKNDLIVKGSLGIGTANPQAQLDIGGVCAVSTSIDINTGNPQANVDVRGGQITVRATADPDARSVTLGLGAAGGFIGVTGVAPSLERALLGIFDDGGGLLQLRGASPNELEAVIARGTANGGKISIFGPSGSEQVSLAPGSVNVLNPTGTRGVNLEVLSDGTGAVFADVKNFRMAHPTQPGMDIVYACIEGPEAAAYVRGTGQLVNGEAKISLPDHFVSVANPETMTVQVTPLSADSHGLSVVAKRLDDFVVKELHCGAGSYDFDWEVKCVRKGHESYAVTRPQREAVSQNGLAPQAPMEMRASLTREREISGGQEAS